MQQPTLSSSYWHAGGPKEAPLDVILEGAAAAVQPLSGGALHGPSAALEEQAAIAAELAEVLLEALLQPCPVRPSCQNL